MWKLLTSIQAPMSSRQSVPPGTGRWVGGGRPTALGWLRTARTALVCRDRGRAGRSVVAGAPSSGSVPPEEEGSRTHPRAAGVSQRVPASLPAAAAQLSGPAPAAGGGYGQPPALPVYAPAHRPASGTTDRPQDAAGQGQLAGQGWAVPHRSPPGRRKQKQNLSGHLGLSAENSARDS